MSEIRGIVCQLQHVETVKAILASAAENSRDQWPRSIPVSEHPPKSGDVVLLWCWVTPADCRGSGDSPRWVQGNLVDFPEGEFFSYSGRPLYDVAHWLPMPPDPE